MAKLLAKSLASFFAAVSWGFLSEQFGIFVGVPNEERAAETGRECCRWFRNSHLGPSNFRGVAADEVIHRFGRLERTHLRQHPECIASQKNDISGVTRNARDLRILDSNYVLLQVE